VSPRKDKTGPQWHARGINNTCWILPHRACAIAAATAYSRLWNLAESSDLLVTEDQFSPEAAVVRDACDVIPPLRWKQFLLRTRQSSGKRVKTEEW
jgi:hypothetical protein